MMGALTSKPYAFTARPWELSDASVFDYFDTIHSPLRLSVRGGELLRVLPDLRYSLINEWISDRARFSYDSVSAVNRLSQFTFFFRGKPTSYSAPKNFIVDFLLFRFTFTTFPNFDFFGLEQAGFSNTVRSRQGLSLSSASADFLPPVFSPQNLRNFKSIFIVGLSVRYTHPVLLSYLKQLKSSGLLFFDFGEALSVSDYSHGGSLHAFFNFFRFKSKTSIYQTRCFYLTSFRFFSKFFNFFPFASSAILHESSASSSSYFFGSLPILSSLAPFTLNFSGYSSSASDFSIPVPHFYETSFSFSSAVSSRVSVATETLSSNTSAYDFFSSFNGIADNYLTFSDSDLVVSPSASLVARPSAFSNLYSTYNHYDHFLGHASLVNSTNILLNLRRNEDHRHNHFYYF